MPELRRGKEAARSSSSRCLRIQQKEVGKASGQLLRGAHSALMVVAVWQLLAGDRGVELQVIRGQAGGYYGSIIAKGCILSRKHEAVG